MTGVGWQLADLLSGLLEPDERDAVRGDLIESRVSGRRALRDVLGLVVRRQAMAWLEWRPWMALVTVVIPIGVLLSHASRWLADTSALNLSHYYTVWDFAYLGYPGWRNDLLEIIALVVLKALALISWSWTTGFLLARMSRSAVWMTGALFFLAVFAATLGTSTMARGNEQFSNHFIGVVVPRLVRVFLVLLPAYAGMRRGLRNERLPVFATVIAAVAIIIVTTSMSRSLEGAVTFGRRVIPRPGPDGAVGTHDDPRPLWPLSLVMLWPTAFIVSTTALGSRPREG
jgi:hypothetical protein